MQKLLKTALILAFIVVILGAWTRLSDAGLGCPDWPTCYGSILVPDSIADSYQQPLEKVKAWKEMIHRYAASTLGLLIVIIFVIAFKSKNIINNNIKLPITILLFLVLFQGALGVLTVTELVHPGIVSMHLLGGFFTTSLIFYILLKTKYEKNNLLNKFDKKLLYLIIILIFGQIFLGGWVSTNYAALACGDFFPSCLGGYYHPIDLNAIFYWGELGINYEYGTLSSEHRIAIQLVHRLGAVVITLSIITLMAKFIKHKHLHKNIALTSGLLIVQIILGITNVVASLPIFIAVMHNIVALLLVVSIIRFFYSIYRIY